MQAVLQVRQESTHLFSACESDEISVWYRLRAGRDIIIYDEDDYTTYLKRLNTEDVHTTGCEREVTLSLQFSMQWQKEPDEDEFGSGIKETVPSPKIPTTQKPKNHQQNASTRSQIRQNARKMVCMQSQNTVPYLTSHSQCHLHHLRN